MHLTRVINNAYSGRKVNRWYSETEMRYEVKYLNIPIKKDETIEIPVCASNILNEDNELNVADYDEFAISLICPDYETHYVSAEPIFKDVFLNEFLTKINITKNGNTYTYYGMMGLILDIDYAPLVMASWRAKCETDDEGNFYLKGIKPILRVSPDVFSKSNPFLSFLSGKLLTTVMYEGVDVYAYARRSLGLFNVTHMPVSIEIEKIPYKVISPAPPSINTTREDLLKVVWDNKEELVCP